MNTTASNKKISEVLKLYRDWNLKIQPTFQRKYVWTKKHRSNFIDTILKMLPFPEVYFATLSTDLTTMETLLWVVDWQQRLQTIFHYIEWTGDFDNWIPKFSELNPDEQTKFLEYIIAVRDLGNADIDQIREIFTRINQTKFNLNDIEIENAVYDWEFITIAKEIANAIDLSEIFSESNITRMQDIEFILLIMTTLESKTYFIRNKNIESFIQRYNEEYLNSKEMFDIITFYINEIMRLELAPDSIWFNKWNFFTLLIESIVNKITIDNEFKSKLIEFEANIVASKNIIIDNPEWKDFNTYYQNMFTWTNSRQARVMRWEIFRKYILS